MTTTKIMMTTTTATKKCDVQTINPSIDLNACIILLGSVYGDTDLIFISVLCLFSTDKRFYFAHIRMPIFFLNVFLFLYFSFVRLFSSSHPLTFQCVQTGLRLLDH